MFTGEPTRFLKLPQYEAKDHPDFLTDFNQAFRTIDASAMKNSNSIEYLQRELEVARQEIRQLRIDVGLSNATKGGNNNE